MKEAATFRPTADEFRDPYIYLAAIRKEAEPHGIIRIIPPAGWRCPCHVDFKSEEKIASKRQRIDLLQLSEPFDNGAEYTLNSYGHMADDFARGWVKKKRPRQESLAARLDHDTLEMDYWTLVDDGEREDGVCVDYGNDIDATTHWSGFPRGPPQENLSVAFLDEVPPFSQEYYGRSGWNLNNIARWPGSVLRHYAEPLSGVTSPWLYLGMLYSTFPWHNEDNYFYSINYHHAGAPKQWYGAPGAKAQIFEQALQDIVSDGGHAMEDGSLHNINTMVSPYELARRGVPMVKLRQMPGEFVVTFPRAYHGGFSLGFNIGEAVNFATPDWVQHARSANEHYRSIARLGVISHDRIMFGMAHNCHLQTDIESCIALRDEVWRLCEEEARMRPHLYRAQGVRDLSAMLPAPGNNVHVCAAEDADFDDTRVCRICRHTCYASIVACNCSPESLCCLRHVDYVCRCPASNRYLIEWEPVDKLEALARRVDVRLAFLRGEEYVPTPRPW